MTWWRDYHGVDGAYTAYYHYSPTDSLLNRYFALIGGNDPVCWWLGKNDRFSYSQTFKSPYTTFSKSKSISIPSIGDNGFFCRRSVYGQVNPDTHFCIDAIEDIHRKHDLTFFVSGTTTVWHKSGDSLLDYMKRRYRYTKELYWRDYEKRRWKMVSNLRDLVMVIIFAISSILVVPHLITSARGYLKLKDTAWLLHPVVSLGITGLYTWLFIRFGIARLFALWTAPLRSHDWCTD